MVNILGLLLFFGLTATVLWLFHEALWRADDPGEFRSHPERGVKERRGRPENDQGECSPNSNLPRGGGSPPDLTTGGTTDLADHR